jgi:hypothetical protein
MSIAEKLIDLLTGSTVERVTEKHGWLHITLSNATLAFPVPTTLLSSHPNREVLDAEFSDYGKPEQ